ncbi:GbsR/MarR family transcriptional regulator [Motiliproteus sp. MSK22-1]|uniref:GbsR/MarR family transcriptional regulator n=1 Tax=Motiliproteus sp. MSK22-1 TaxID=1897630 RepID=UPI0009F8CC18|nr:GbsR/MarR family transcriptional regulator [Motiliproteus sp. MSK22-1]
MTISPMIESFVFHFGEMGSRWGFNRTVGQMYALMVVSDKPINANEIAEVLNISRGNVSMGIKELQSWQLIQLHHYPGDRKEYYSPKGDIWDMANTVFEERRKREVDPTLSLLRDILLEQPGNDSEAYAQNRMREIHDLLETLVAWTSELQGLNPDKLNRLMKLGTGVSKVMDLLSKANKSSSAKSKSRNKDQLPFRDTSNTHSDSPMRDDSND